MKGPPASASQQIQKALDDSLGRTAGGEGGPPAPRTVEAATPRGSVSVSLDDVDRLGVLAGPITARRREGETGDVKSQAREAVRRLGYLQEPLTIVESEGRRGGGRAILRSEAPRTTERGSEYNEAVLQGGDSITIQRYRATSGSRRKPVPSNLSREALGRLADDLIDIVGKG